jgi:hypothetical protein
VNGEREAGRWSPPERLAARTSGASGRRYMVEKSTSRRRRGPDLALHTVADAYHARPVWISVPQSDTGGSWTSSAPETDGGLKPARTWRQVGRSDPLREVLTAVLAHLPALLEHDPWIPFPQTSCFAVFGEECRTLPLGALNVLWQRSADFTGPCPQCGGRLYGYLVSGILQVAGVSACCVDCGANAQRSLGIARQAARAVAQHLRDTEFHVRAVLPNGAFPGSCRPLLRALHALGWSSLHTMSALLTAEAPPRPRIHVPEFPSTPRPSSRRLQVIEGVAARVVPVESDLNSGKSNLT